MDSKFFSPIAYSAVVTLVQARGGKPSPGADVGGVEPSPGADVSSGEPSPGADVSSGEPSPGADVAASPVLAQMWHGEPGPGADVSPRVQIPFDAFFVVVFSTLVYWLTGLCTEARCTAWLPARRSQAARRIGCG